jgi:hypothetical protein
MGSYYPSDKVQTEMKEASIKRWADIECEQERYEEAVRYLAEKASGFTCVLMGGHGLGPPSKSRWKEAFAIRAAYHVVTKEWMKQ